MEGLDLDSVIERARGQDAEALRELYRHYVRRVFGLCRHMLDSREKAEDAGSEVFLKLQRSIKSYDGSIPFTSGGILLLLGGAALLLERQWRPDQSAFRLVIVLLTSLPTCRFPRLQICRRARHRCWLMARHRGRALTVCNLIGVEAPLFDLQSSYL